MSMFANATVVPAKKTAAKGAIKNTVEMDGLEEYAALEAAMKALKGHQTSFKSKLLVEMGDRFCKDGCKLSQKPESFDAVDGAASGNMQFRIRSSASPLSEEEQEILTDNDIPFGDNTKIEETFIINPAYAADMDLLAKVEAALSKVKGLPADFIQKQEGHATKIITDESLSAVFKKPVHEAAILLPLVSTLAIKAKIGGDFMPVIDRIMAPAAPTKGKKAA